MRIKHIAIICAVAFVSMVLMSLQISDNTYTEMWKKVKESLSKDLPETAEKQLDAIEKAALSDKNQPQLLKSILYRKQIFSIKEEDTPEKAYIDYAAKKFEVLDEVASALLHIDVAMTYSNYLDMNDWTIRNNLPIADDMSDVEMKYWDKDTFRKLIDQHLDMALQNPEVLKKAETKDWLLIYDDRKDIDKYIEYEMSMFEFVCHSIVNYYKNISSANDVNEAWNTQSWWLEEKDFVKVKLDESDSPVIRCLKLFQDLISFSMEKGKESVLVFHDVK
ncbi:MAG: hypothetical protein J6W61_00680, partial [Bacteroidales bacterium]|nr:hypothetical protein [Bacteroidales bacterium]